MGKASSRAASPPPKEEAVKSALDLLKERIMADLARIPGLIPGSQSWLDALQRRVDNEVSSGSFILALKQEVAAAILLAQGGKGPVTRNDVDLA